MQGSGSSSDCVTYANQAGITLVQQETSLMVAGQRPISGMNPTRQVASPYTCPGFTFGRLYEVAAFNAFDTAVDDDDHDRMLAARPFARSLPASEIRSSLQSIPEVGAPTDSGDEEDYIVVRDSLPPTTGIHNDFALVFAGDDAAALSM